MKIYALLIAAAASAAARTAGDTTSFLGIFAETHSMRMAGQKVREMPKLPPGITLPPAARGMFGGPSRILTVRLYTPTIAPDDATASIAPPAGLKLGDKLNLDLFRAKPEAVGTGTGAPGSRGGSQNPQDFTIKFYWGSHDTVPADQPKVITFGTLTNEEKMEMASQMQKANPNAGSNYYYKDNWTTGYWPTSAQPGDIAKDASLNGTFALTTSYAGNVSIDAPDNVDFLAPIEMTSPDLNQKPNLANSLPFQWTAIPNAIGLYATAIGMEGKNTLIIWSSSESFSEQLMADQGFLQMADVRARVDANQFMPGTQTNVTIPAGIFQNSSFAMFSMVGYGPGAAREGVVPVPRIQTKTTLQIMLGGTKSH